jgi:hypothetical protein
MPYFNKRNRFIAAAKNYAEDHKKNNYFFTKDELRTIASSINMKGAPTWVLNECKCDVRTLAHSKKCYDMSALIQPVSVPMPVPGIVVHPVAV